MKINWLALEIELLEAQSKAVRALVRSTNLLTWLHNRDERGEIGATLSYRSNAFDAELSADDASALEQYAARANARAREVERLATATEAPEYVERVRVLRLLTLLSLARLGANINPPLSRETWLFLDRGVNELAAKFAQEVGAANEEEARLAVAADVQAVDDLF
ncbi:MAG: hypothetical protein IKU86_07500 [Thermoguttaceae bacterium]|nr:hypothetical protein [Thermoguttaceae bacterium]